MEILRPPPDMFSLTRRSIGIALVSFVIAPIAVCAAPRQYQLDPNASQVGFRYVLNGAAQTGTMPILSAAIIVDPDNLAASSVDVSVSVGGARTGLVFATQALLGPEVLDAANYPTIRFVSHRVTLAADGRLSGGATIDGDLTIRGRTRPTRLVAALYRVPGSELDDLSTLHIRLSGRINRSAFGAVGYAELVADIVELDILAVIRVVQ